MANQIAAYFATFPKDDALEGIAGHLRDFWEPRMRARLSTHVAAGGEGLSPLVIDAVRRAEGEG